MLNALRALVRFCRESIGWNRIGFVVSITIIAIALWVLVRILRHIDVEQVVAALRSTPPRDLALAGLFVAVSYLMLTFYDLFALRTIGKSHIPYRIAALASFTSYAIGHNVGASAITGAAVRYRIYSAWGLAAVDVVKVSLVAGLTFWLGNAAVLGLGIALEPKAAAGMDQLPPWVNRGLAIMVLLILTYYLMWVSQKSRVVGRNGWQVTLPNGSLTFLQITIGIVDLTFCSLAMYTLTPSEPHIAFVTLGVIFVTATLLGFASSSPGGLGVFDAAMLVGLWQFDKETLIAGLLLFRLLYYIIPFIAALAILGIRELWLDISGPGMAREPPIPTSDEKAQEAPGENRKAT